MDRCRTLPVLLLLAVACAPADGPQPPTAPDAVKREFLALADALEAGNNPYFGRAPLDALHDELSDPELLAPLRVLTLMRLAERETQLGLLEDAVAHADEAVDTISGPASASAPGSELRKAYAAAHLVRAMAYLRLAEQRNCAGHRGPDSCIFPIRGGGVHADPSAAAAAGESLRAYLDQRPGDLEARWLFNIVAMTLGRFPDAVPEGLRIDPRAREAGRGLPRFIDAAPEAGISGNELAGGVVVEDVDGDGRLDIVTSTSDPRGSLRFYRNEGNGGWSDRTKASGLDVQLGGLNVIGSDYDGDADIDLLVLRGAWHLDQGRMRNSLLRNDDGVFVDVTAAAGLAGPAMPTQAACWGDFDNDGDLDLYIGNEAYEPLGLDFPSQLFRNDGDGTFTDVARDAGVSNGRYAKGVTAGDYDDDGDLDLYVSNAGENRLYRNDGNLRFTDVAPALGLTGPAPRSFAPWFFDFDNDGDLDLWVGAYEALLPDVVRDYLGEKHAGTPPALYRNEGDGSFTDVAVALGLDRPWMPMGANFGDFDNDGYLDIYLGTGNPNLKTLVPNVALRNVSGSRFEDVTVSTGLGHLQKGHGVAFADLDRDGDQDLYHQLGGFYPSDRFGNALFLNPGSGGAQIDLELRGAGANRLAVGARVEVVASGPEGRRSFHRAVGSVSSFGGSPVGRLSVGLGAASGPVEVRVRWPRSSTPVAYTGLQAGEFYRLEEGKSEPQRLERPRLDRRP